MKPKNKEPEILPNRPQPVSGEVEMYEYKRRIDPQIAVDALMEGHFVLVADFYSSGLAVLNQLKQFLQENPAGNSFQDQRLARNTFREVSHRLLVKVSNHRLLVRKAPEIGWLKILYPELSEFFLPFPQVQGLNSAWQWYEKGLFIPVLKTKIHPWYGTYFPTRFEHLELFDHWLKNHHGEKQLAMDVGTGSGLLALMLMKHGFRHIVGTDTNPNAIIGFREFLSKREMSENFRLLQGNLFAGCDESFDLIVFNPPWLPAQDEVASLDEAIYYGPELFPAFFEEASKYLNPGGNLVILFSNIGQVTNMTTGHPIEKELAEGGRFVKARLMQKKVRPASKNTKRDANWRTEEIVELWVLKAV